MTPQTTRRQILPAISNARAEEVPELMTERWIQAVFPRIELCIGCMQDPIIHSEGDVAVHTGMVLEAAKRVYPYRLGESLRTPIVVAVFWDDSQKPSCRVADLEGRVSFPGHEEMAAVLAPEIAGRLGFSEAETEELTFVVRNHGLAHEWPTLSRGKKAELRASPYFRSLMAFQEADALSCINIDGGHLPVHWDLAVQK